MAYTDINSEDRLVQATFAEHLESVLGWDSIYAWNQETFGPTGTLGRINERDAVLVRDLRSALVRLNPHLPPPAIEEAITKLGNKPASSTTEEKPGLKMSLAERLAAQKAAKE